MKIRLVKCKLVSWSSADMLLRFREAVPHKKRFFLERFETDFDPAPLSPEPKIHPF